MLMPLRQPLPPPHSSSLDPPPTADTQAVSKLRSGLSAADQYKSHARAGRFGDGKALGGVQSWSSGSPQVLEGCVVSSPSASELSDTPPFPSKCAKQWHINKRRAADDDDSDMDVDLSQVVIVGTCQSLEKSYFRLTAAPAPSSVRPEPVLRRALQRLVAMIRDGSANWFYACDQFKGLRQVRGI